MRDGRREADIRRIIAQPAITDRGIMAAGILIVAGPFIMATEAAVIMADHTMAIGQAAIDGAATDTNV
jgi:hypothetical protein